MKTCFKCHTEKPLSEFYKAKGMKDGTLNKCKKCAKLDSTKYRNNNIEKIRAYDRERGRRQDDSYLKKFRDKYPKKYKAHNLVNNSLRSGKIIKRPCEVCGNSEKVHAHHDDYNIPLQITWLCPAHHSQWHARNGEGANAS